VTIVLVFFVADGVFGATVAAVAAAAFATLSLSPRLLFSAAYAEHFVCAGPRGVLVLLHAIDRRRMSAFFGSGLLFGTAFLMKQSGGAFLAFAVLYTLLGESDAAAGGSSRAGPSWWARWRRSRRSVCSCSSQAPLATLVLDFHLRHTYATLTPLARE